MTNQKKSSNLPVVGKAAMTVQYNDLSKKTILITGGANGIGEAMVHAFCQQNSHVHFCDIDDQAGKRVERDTDGKATFSRVDLTRETAIRRWIQQTSKMRGAIDALINNAASDPRIPFSKMRTAQWDELFKRNLRAYFITAQSAVPHMVKGAAIINLSSVTFHVPPMEMTAYVSTKAGIQGLTRSLARELGKQGIRVNTISPGWVMTRRQLTELVTPSVKRMIKRVQCIPDLLQPREIAHIALFLASRASRALTGQELLADRGWAHS